MFGGQAKGSGSMFEDNKEECKEEKVPVPHLEDNKEFKEEKVPVPCLEDNKGCKEEKVQECLTGKGCHLLECNKEWDKECLTVKGCLLLECNKEWDKGRVKAQPLLKQKELLGPTVKVLGPPAVPTQYLCLETLALQLSAVLMARSKLEKTSTDPLKQASALNKTSFCSASGAPTPAMGTLH